MYVFLHIHHIISTGSSVPGPVPSVDRVTAFVCSFQERNLMRYSILDYRNGCANDVIIMLSHCMLSPYRVVDQSSITTVVERVLSNMIFCGNLVNSFRYHIHHIFPCININTNIFSDNFFDPYGDFANVIVADDYTDSPPH